ncbi:hypothetical protein [Polaribacter vadi]|uniref:hypothetical protein n=1 Tax=Polaribacter vadi TaxID=1774273 RepID=UPI0030EE9040|tara:strand:+ start:34422 stop:34622 length:201 start_codon:yes stop_codon:yes gene_type:complete
MKHLKQVLILTKKSHKNYLKDFPEEQLIFQEYVNFELGRLFDNKHAILSIDFLSKEMAIVVYDIKI